MNCHYFAKKNHRNRTDGSGDILLRRKKITENWVPKTYFRPSGTQMGPNFRFYVLFLFSDKKQRVWYITRGIYPAFLENRIFFTLFCTIASFYKISHRSKTSGHRKKRMWFSALESKTAYAQMFFSSFWGQKSILRWK